MSFKFLSTYMMLISDMIIIALYIACFVRVQG